MLEAALGAGTKKKRQGPVVDEVYPESEYYLSTNSASAGTLPCRLVLQQHLCTGTMTRTGTGTPAAPVHWVASPSLTPASAGGSTPAPGVLQHQVYCSTCALYHVGSQHAATNRPPLQQHRAAPFCTVSPQHGGAGLVWQCRAAAVAWYCIVHAQQDCGGPILRLRSQ